MSYFCGFSLKSAGIGVEAHQVQGEVAHHLGRRRHLHQAAEDAVRRGVHVLDRLEALAQAQRHGLLAQVGELAARDLVLVDPAGGARQAGLERRVDPAHGFPVRLQGADVGQAQAGVARRVGQRGDEGRGRGLAGGAGQGGRGDVHGVHAGVHGRQERGQLAACGVVGVQVDREVEPLPQGRDQLAPRQPDAAGRPCP